MSELIAVILIVLGGLGLLVCVALWFLLKGPEQDLRNLLDKLSKEIGLGAQKVGNLQPTLKKTGGQVLKSVDEGLQDVAEKMGDASQSLEETGGYFHSGADILKKVAVPTVTFETQHFGGFSVPTDLGLDHFSVKIPVFSLDDIDILGHHFPVITGLQWDSIDIPSLKPSFTKILPMDLPTGLKVELEHPLESWGEDLDQVDQKLQDTAQKLDQGKEAVNRLRTKISTKGNHFLTEAEEKVAETEQQLQKVQKATENLSKSKWISLLPKIILGVGALIQSMMILLGIALLS